MKKAQDSSASSLSSYESASNISFERRDKMDDDDAVHNLTNEISMLSVTSNEPSPRKKKTSSRDVFSITMWENRENNVLDTVDDADEMEILMRLYPELKTPNRKPTTIREESEEDKENRPSDSSKDDSSQFENYLKSLREDKPKVQPKERVPIKKFVVDDDVVVLEEESSDEEPSYEVSDRPSSASSVEDLKTRKYEEKNKDEDDYFLKSLALQYKYKRHADAVPFVKENALKMERNRTALLEKLVEIYSRRCFREIPKELISFTWNARLRKTAGLCRNHSKGNSSIELSKTVCTAAERVRDTLAHEMCHAAVWIVSKKHKEGHGPEWKKWASRCMKTFPSLPVIERCHNYEIEAKYVYVCSNEECSQKIKRQSKSLDIERKICGLCRSRFVLFVKGKKVLQPAGEASTKQPTLFAQFVKQEYQKYRSGASHQEVMKILSAKFKERKEAVQRDVEVVTLD